MYSIPGQPCHFWLKANTFDLQQPRYIEALLSASSKRKIELERAEERKIQREREEDGDKFGEKDMFVTEAYLQRKEELRKIEEEEKRKEGCIWTVLIC